MPQQAQGILSKIDTTTVVHAAVVVVVAIVAYHFLFHR